VPLVPRGWYVFDGYAAQRRSDNSPGLSTPASQNLDAAAMSFLEDAGRGGYGGYVSSDADDNEYLLSSNSKFLSGYPLDGVSEADKGKLFATTPANLAFTRLYASVFATTNIQSFPGNSGGPLYVQTDINQYLPAAIFLGGSGQTVVRAINREVVDLINRAEISGNGGGNSTGGGVVVFSPGVTASPFNPGLFTVTLSPPQAITRGAGWRVASVEDKTYINDNQLRYPLIPGPFNIEFSRVSGFIAPATRRIEVVANQTTSIQADYAFFQLTPGTWTKTNGYLVTVTGSTGRVYMIDASANLTNWTTLATLTNFTGTIQFRDAASTNQPRRFYRGRELN
jgi:hypothetical protein